MRRDPRCPRPPVPVHPGRGQHRSAEAEEDVSTEELQPLCESIDPDALNDLLTPQNEDDQQSHIRVVFTYSGYRIAVANEGQIQLTPLDEE
ncbi:HalOD1 output domain-containing protein [Haladaptatus salinisoli]|uniref:HalOD1 output domain-containing protein n=1 Tax=Haladaptatus salinisoli TaxID=2884876 RepID=UPI001D0A4743